ncbi:MAG: alpha/beta hydrolase-fold protein [Aggregatilineales bacterium]
MSEEPIHHLLARAQADGNPIIEGDTVTFVWEGEEAPFLLGDFNSWGHADDENAILMTQIAPKVWTKTITLPRDAYIEYLLTTDVDDDEARIPDPLNPNLVDNGMKELNNFFYMPDAELAPIVREGHSLPQGVLSRHVITNKLFLAGGERDVWLYQPIVTTEPTPLLVVYDGYQYLKQIEITRIVDRLIAQKSIPPIALAMIDSGEDMRIVEYMAGDAMLKVVTEDVLSLAKEKLDLLDIETHHGAFGVCGASMGGLMAYYSALRFPHIFGRAICQSSSLFLFHNDPHSPIKALINSLDPTQYPLKFWFDIGTYETNPRIQQETTDMLNKHGFQATFQQFSGGHNNTNWQRILDRALITIFGDD